MRTTLAGCLMPHPPIIPNVCLDGPVWTQSVLPDFRSAAIAYGAGVFVVGGLDEVTDLSGVLTSLDGITWTLEASPPVFSGGFAISLLAYGNGWFVGFADFTEGARSADGSTWSAIALACTKTDLYFGGGIFVLISGGSDQIRISADGSSASWSAKTLPANTQWSHGAYGGGRHLVIDTTTRAVAKSDDAGLTWQSLSTLPAGYTGRVAYGNGVFVVLNDANSDAVAYSTDAGATWNTSVISGAAVILSEIHFQQGVFLVVNTGGQVLRTSTDGVTWNQLVNLMPVALTNLIKYAFNGAHRYAAVHVTNPGSTAGAWGEC